MSNDSNQAPGPASIRSRFQFTLAVNASKTLTAFAAGLIIARGLGPEEFGSFAFLSGICLTIRQLLDLGSATAFYTFISQKRRPLGFFLYYFAWTAAQLLIPLFVFGLLAPRPIIESIWLGHSRSIVLVAITAMFLRYQIWELIVQIGESARLTHRTQGMTLFSDLFYLAAVLVMWRTGTLSLSALFFFIIAEYVMVSIAAYFVVWRERARVDPFADGRDFDPGGMFGEFAGYCGPLVIYTFAGFAYQFADRWMLQKFGGGEQQAFFEIGYRFSMISMIATTSILRIFWKEIAEAIEKKDDSRARRLFTKVSKLLFVCGASISCFLIPWSREILSVFLGDNYAAAAPALALMLLYPVHQTLGQIGGTMYYAMGATRASVTISIVFMIISIPATFFLLGPADGLVMGMNLGSMGLALKMVILQLVNVNVLIWWLARIRGWHFDWKYQLVSLALFSVAGFGMYAVTFALGDSIAMIALRAFFSLSGYILIIAAVVRLYPEFAGLTSEELRQAVASIRSLLGISRNLGS